MFIRHYTIFLILFSVFEERFYKHLQLKATRRTGSRLNPLEAVNRLHFIDEVQAMMSGYVGYRSAVLCRRFGSLRLVCSFASISRHSVSFAMSTKYWLWLVPDEGDANASALTSIIASYGGPTFPPHVQLATIEVSHCGSENAGVCELSPSFRRIAPLP